MLEIGSLLDGKYKILNEIGHGGMSVVYLALNERANKTWAVKEVRKDGGNDTTVVSQNLVAETEMLKKLDHPNLPSIIDVIDKDDSFIIVMDYIEGNSLQDLIDTDGPQHPEKVIEWAKQLCDVLGYLHSRRPPIIYRDMKPANVMLRPTGDVTLIDFGTAREYKYANQADTTYLGTRGYAAPEQFGGRGQTDARTDIYTLGATMYHLITGYSPADTNFEVLPIGKFVPQLKGSGLEKIITKCCQNDPAKRYQDCAELMAALNLVHKYDDKERLRRRMKLGVFAACVAISLISLVSGIGFRMALANTRTEQYAAYLTSARNAMDFSQKIADYKQAINLDPGDPEAYQGLIDDIDSLSDDEFIAAYNSITDCINGVDYDPANRKRNIEYLKDRDVATYSDFNFRLGTLVYLVYPSGQGASISYLNEAVESLYKKTKEAGQNKNTIVFEHEFADYWATLDDLSIRLDTLKSQTNIGYPIRICDTIATEINLHCVNYMNDNVARDTILQTLDRANNFMNNAKSSSPDQLEVIKRVRSNVTKAYDSVDDCFSNTSKVNPDAADSEEEGGDI